MKSKPICKNVYDFSQFQVRTPIKISFFSNYEKKKVAIIKFRISQHK